MSQRLFTSDIWLPPPKLTISEWADEFRHIPPEASAESGLWSTARAEYQREIMNAISDSRVERVIMMTAAQVGKTEILLNTIGYYIDKEPSPLLLIYPTLQMAESFSKDRLSPMIRDTPVLTPKIADPRTRDSGNTLLHKKFTGGHITLAGANSPASLASRPIRILLCDEVDKYPESAGTEGDPLSLAMKRTQNFWNRRIVFVSTPTLRGLSRIYPEYENSSKEEWNVPCPECGYLNSFDWERIEYRGKTEPVMHCKKCGNSFSEREWKAGQLRGKWIADNPKINSIRGFHLNAFASPWATWPDLINQYEEAYRNGEEQLKAWVQGVLGVPYESSGGIAELREIEMHSEEYDAEVPEGVLVLTAGIDVQDDRLECEIVGWGMNSESWGIDYRVISGSPGSPETWQRLDEHLLREWKYADDTGISVSCACIDSGGHFTDEVYKFTQTRTKRCIFSIIGRGQMGLPSVSKLTRNNRRKVLLFTLGVSTIKGVLHMRLKAEKGEPGYCHFPLDEEKRNRGYDRKYFQGLLSERMIMKRDRGREVIRWEQVDRHVRNEPLDCRVYATGALEILNPNMERRKAMREGGHVPERKPVQRRKTGLRMLRGGMR